MANVTANVSTVDVTVTSTPSNITVTDVDTSTNITLTSATTNVAVTTTQLEVNVAPLTSVSNSVIRAALSVDDTGGDGSLTYDNIDGIFTYTGPNQDEANARIDGAPANVRAHLSHTTGVANYSPVTGVITIPGDTDDVTEGNTNLFYTDQRVLDKVFEIVSGNTPRYFGWGPGLQIISSGNAASWFLTADTDDIPEGSNLYFTTARVDSHLLSGVNNNVTINGELFVNGNAVVAGNLDYENVTDLYVTDQKITLNANAVTNSNVEIIANRPAATSTSLKWNEDSDTWTFTNDGTTYYPIPTSTTDLAEGNNLYYTNARVLAYIQDNGLDFNAEKVDDRVANLLVSGSANLTYSYDDGANTLTLTQTLTTDDISEGTNQYFTNARVRSAITDGNIVLKQFAETNYSLGITNGNITVDAANGTVQSVVLNGDMTGLDIINNADCTTIQLFIQSQFGNEEIDTTTYPSNWSNWYFTDNDTTLASGVGGRSLMIVSNDVNGVKLASVTRFEDPAPIAGNFDSNVVLNFGQTTDEDAYVFAHRPVAGTNVAIRWNETTDKWQFTNDGSTYYDLLTGEVGLGTVTSVTAGAGMTQSGNANVNPTLDVVGGYGITVNADNLEVTNADIQAQANVAFGNNTTDNLTQGTTNLYYSTTLANADIDARVTKTFVDGLGVDYNTLSNLPTIPTHTSNLINDSGFITSATANVISVNGATGVVVLDTDDISEGATNKYYSSTLFNADFATKTTSDLTEGANLYFTTGRANSAIDAYVAGGNAITVASGVVSLDNTAVTPGTYGNATTVAQVTVDQQGRLTGVTDVPISGLAQANSFGIISVSGQANVEADVATDQVTFVAGSGVTITTDAATDSITFNSTGGYGNVDVQNFLENGYGSGNILTAGNITGGYIIAGNDAGGDGYFIGDINGAIQNEVYNASGSTLNKGDIVALNGNNHGDTPDVVLADAGNASLMPGFGVVKNSISPGVTGEVVISGKMNFPNSFTVGAQLYVNSAGQFTETQPSGEANLVQKIAKVVSSTSINVAGAGRTNATPNLDNGNIFIGDATNKAVSIDLDNFTYAISSNADISTTANVDATIVNTRRQYHSLGGGDYNYVDLDNSDEVGFANIMVLSGKFSVKHIFDSQGSGADNWSVSSGSSNIALANTWLSVAGAVQNGKLTHYGDEALFEGIVRANSEGTGLFVTNQSQFDGSITAVDATFNGDVLVDEYDLDVRSESNTNYIHSSVTKYADPEADLTYVTPHFELIQYGGNISSPTTLSSATATSTGFITGGVYRNRGFYLYATNTEYPNPSVEYTGAIEFSTSDTEDYYVGPNFTSGFGPARYQKTVAQGRILFKTMNSDVANATISDGFRDGTSFQNGLQKANATVAYIDNKFNIGREDNGTSFSFPTTAGSTDQFLALDANSDLQWTSTLNNVTLGQFQETKVDLGSVSGDQSSALDAASGSIYTLTATGGITINSLANAVAGTSMTIIITQDGTGSHALTSSMKFAGGNKTLSTAPGSIDIISVFYDGTNYYASLTLGYA